MKRDFNRKIKIGGKSLIDKKKIFIVMIMIVSFIIGIFFYKKKNNQEVMTLNKVFVETTKVENTIDSEKIKIHITGEVNQPGLIELEVGERVKDAIDMAGGLTNEADISKINLAYILSDGEKIYIPNQNDELDEEQILQTSNSKVNINTATVSELETIPGVGESTAKAIVEYRTETGRFATIEDVQNVSGIGKSKFEKMKDYIVVK